MGQGSGEEHRHDCVQSTPGQIGGPQDEAQDESRRILNEYANQIGFEMLARYRIRLLTVL